MDTRAVVEMYAQAWNEDDEGTRRRLLAESWAGDGVYADPNGMVEGRDALLGEIAEFRARGIRVEITSRVDDHGPYFRFAWTTRDRAGAVLKEGVDFGQLADDGRIALVVGFFGSL